MLVSFMGSSRANGRGAVWGTGLGVWLIVCLPLRGILAGLWGFPHAAQLGLSVARGRVLAVFGERHDGVGRCRNGVGSWASKAKRGVKSEGLEQDAVDRYC